MSSEYQQYIEKIRNEFNASDRVKEGYGNSLRILAKDLYSKDIHFIFELIQNAEDNIYPENIDPALSFELMKLDPTETKGADGVLIIKNNEIGFTNENVSAICNVGESTKSKFEGYIGEKGIGFKSVFKISSTPYIISNGFRFSLPEHDEETGLGYIVPRWHDNPSLSLNFPGTIILLPLDKPEFNYEIVRKMISAIDPVSILFLSKIKKIEIKIEEGDNFVVQKDDTDYPIIQLLVEGEKDCNKASNIEEYLLFSEKFQRPEDIIQEKRENISEREVSIVYPLNFKNAVKGKIFAYLPTNTESGFPFIINADFILPSSREEIRDVHWNRWLLKCLAKLVGNSLSILAEKNILTINLLQLFAMRLRQLNDKDGMYYPIYESVTESILTANLLATQDGYSNAKEVILLGSSGLVELFEDPSQVKEVFGRSFFLSEEISSNNRNTSELYYYLRNNLNVPDYDLTAFITKISFDFLKKQSDKWLITFYKLFHSAQSYRFISLLKNKPIIRTENGDQIAPFKENGVANVYLPTDEQSIYLTVKRNIANNEDAREFLEKDIGLKSPDMFSEIREFIIPRMELAQKYPEYFPDFEKIISAYKKDKNKFDTLKDELRKIPFILGKNLESGEEKHLKYNDIYFLSENLHTYFYNNPSAFFIDFTLFSFELEENLKIFFTDIGISSCLRRLEISPEFDSQEKEKILSGTNEDGSSDWKDYKLDGLIEYFDNDITLAKSIALWQLLAERTEAEHYFHGKCNYRRKYERYDYSHTCYFSSNFIKQLRNESWILIDNELYSPKEIDYSLLPIEYKENEIGSRTLAKILMFKADEIKSIEEKTGGRFIDKEELEEYNEWKEEKKSSGKPEFPSDPVVNPELRREKAGVRASNASPKQYADRVRSVRTSSNNIDPGTYLRNKYTNPSGQIICQICKNVMPFKKRNGDYYLVELNLFDTAHFSNGAEATHLALCPVCAAKYKEFVVDSSDKSEMEKIQSSLIASENPEIDLTLNEEQATIRFVESHFIDLQETLRDYKILKGADNG